MSVSRLIEDFRHAIRTFVELDDDSVIEPWDRVAVLRIDKPETDVWKRAGVDGKLPETFLLMVRNGVDPVYEMLWRPQPGLALEQCPVVGYSKQGDVTIVAANADDWLDALLYSGGAIGGGSEEDLESAREDASREAVRLGDQIADELDRELPELESMGDRWETAQEKWFDAWADAVEGQE